MLKQVYASLHHSCKVWHQCQLGAQLHQPPPHITQVQGAFQDVELITSL
jgi:hypothetical protein